MAPSGWRKNLCCCYALVGSVMVCGPEPTPMILMLRLPTVCYVCGWSGCAVRPCALIISLMIVAMIEIVATRSCV